MRTLRKAFRLLGLDVTRYNYRHKFPADISPEDQEILVAIEPFTMTSMERQIALIDSVRFLIRRGIDGAFVECGVWRGGSMMAVALVLLQEQQTSRDLYLYDTFEGMPPPTDADKSYDGVSAQVQLERSPQGTGVWCHATLDDVRANVLSTGYPPDRVRFIKGLVEETIPMHSIPSPIALLRLDTDWYESTRQELKHLFPRLTAGGALIVDDYGHWQGARKAVDEFFAKQPSKPYMHRIDSTGRLLFKE